MSRFRRSLLGYRRDDVDVAIAKAEEELERKETEIRARALELAGDRRRIDELEQVATALSEKVVERDRELRRLRAELARATSDGDSALGTLTALLGELEEVRRTARGQATRIRLGALREAADLSQRLGELGKRPPGMRERLLESLTEAIARIGDDERWIHSAPATNGHAPVDPADLFNGLVEVEIGPLNDFSQLVGFEDAAKSIAATSEISVTRFSEGRATIAVSLSEPVALLRELEERCDLEFVIRDMRDDRVILDVDD